MFEHHRSQHLAGDQEREERGCAQLREEQNPERDIDGAEQVVAHPTRFERVAFAFGGQTPTPQSRNNAFIVLVGQNSTKGNLVSVVIQRVCWRAFMLLREQKPVVRSSNEFLKPGLLLVLTLRWDQHRDRLPDRLFPSVSEQPLRSFVPRLDDSFEFCAASSSTTPPSIPVGSTWSRSRSACSAASAWIAESTTPSVSSAKLPYWRNNGTPPALASNGCSQPKKPAPKWATPTHHAQTVIITVPRY